MIAAFQELMSGLIDYAGLFPPAKLPMDRAVALYNGYRQCPESWMLGRFICPCTRAEEFILHAEIFLDQARPDNPWRISALGELVKDARFIDRATSNSLAAIADLTDQFSEGVCVDAYECRWPADVLEASDPKQIADLLGSLVGAFDEYAPVATHIFLEVPFGDGWKTKVPAFIESVANARPESAAGHRVSLKIRTGGVTADLFPSPEQVACFVNACVTSKIAFKATAGLHHPIRLFHDSVDTRMHGFINVFGGAMLLANQLIDEAGMKTLLEDEDPDAFEFSEDGFGWNGRKISAEQIAEFRKEVAISFGSCSFDEPVDDLDDLEWL
ncbi:MAG: hypothetical protein DHS20C16_28910 [Phycisphaerae bacterium]|nr:MAG: hypothetical protein DHS20C16_28910 [Phycisphaerae bacterium]